MERRRARARGHDPAAGDCNETQAIWIAALSLLLTRLCGGTELQAARHRCARTSFARRAARVRASLADTKWAGLFRRPTLNQLVGTALEHNFDLRIACRARGAGPGAARHHRAPDRFRSWMRRRSSAANRQSIGRFHPIRLRRDESQRLVFTTSAPRCRGNSTSGARLRRLTEAARAQLSRDRGGRRAVGVSLVSDVMDPLFSASRAGSRAGYQPEDSGRRGGESADCGATQSAGRGVRAGCPAGGATSVHGDRPDGGGAASYRRRRRMPLSLLLGGAPSAQPRGQG